MMTQQDSSINILCFGDSLTAGYSMFGMKSTPYGDILRGVLEDEEVEEIEGEDIDGKVKMKVKMKVNVRIEGVNGELVSRGMEGRMSGIYQNLTEPFDYVIFLGGTNDLGWGKGSKEIYDAIMRVTQIPLASNDEDGERKKAQKKTRLLLCTIPECGVKKESLDRQRGAVNEWIRGDEREDVGIYSTFTNESSITTFPMKGES